MNFDSQCDLALDGDISLAPFLIYLCLFALCLVTSSSEYSNLLVMYHRFMAPYCCYGLLFISIHIPIIVFDVTFLLEAMGFVHLMFGKQFKS